MQKSYWFKANPWLVQWCLPVTPSTMEAEAGEPWVQGQSELHKELSSETIKHQILPHSSPYCLCFNSRTVDYIFPIRAKPWNHFMSLSSHPACQQTLLNVTQSVLFYHYLPPWLYYPSDTSHPLFCLHYCKNTCPCPALKDLTPNTSKSGLWVSCGHVTRNKTNLNPISLSPKSSFYSFYYLPL